MKKLLFILLTVVLMTSCSNKHQDFIDELVYDASNNELGVDLKYKVLEFNMIDTLYNHELADSLQVILTNNIEDIKELDMSEGEFLNLREQENGFRSYGDYDYYKEYVFNDSINSEWLSELREILRKTDVILSDFDNADILDKFELYSWYNRRLWHFHNNTTYKNHFNKFYEKALYLKDLRNEILMLNSNPTNIIHYKGKVKYEQINPFLGGIKQTLTENVYFDNNKKLIK